MTWNKIFLFALCLATCAFSLTAEEALQNSKSWFRKTDTHSFDFRAETFMAQSTASNTQKGHILVSGDNRFRLNISGFTFVSDGKNLWQWNMAQKQVLIKSVEDLESALHPTELLFKYLNCRAISLDTKKWKAKDVYALVLSPEQYAGQFSEMEVWLSKENFSPVRLFTVDAVGNSTWYDISNLKSIKNTKPEEFQFKTPPGVDEIDMR